MGEAIAITKTENPRIYVACLAAYNNGLSIGAQTGTGIGVQKGTTGLMRAHALAGRRRA